MTILPLPHPRTAHEEVSPEHPVSWLRKENPKAQSNLPSILGHLMGSCTLILQHRDFRGSTIGNLTVMEKRVRDWNRQHTGVVRLSPHLPCPSNNPNPWLCSSVEANQGHALTRELSRVQICLIQIRWEVLPALELHLHMSRKGDESQPNCCWRWFSSLI